MVCPNEFKYINKRMIIPLFSSKPGYKLPEIMVKNIPRFCANLKNVLEQYVKSLKMDIQEDETDVSHFVFTDDELNLETLYVTVSNKFNQEFILDAIRVTKN